EWKILTPLKIELAVKLDHNNFLLWRQQVLAAIKGNRLYKFIDPISNISIPNKLNSDGTAN
ncbi:hypothetical protein Ddye_013267, partial [Dipteronia dyeriana]